MDEDTGCAEMQIDLININKMTELGFLPWTTHFVY